MNEKNPTNNFKNPFYYYYNTLSSIYHSFISGAFSFLVSAPILNLYIHHFQTKNFRIIEVKRSRSRSGRGNMYGRSVQFSEWTFVSIYKSLYKPVVVGFFGFFFLVLLKV